MLIASIVMANCLQKSVTPVRWQSLAWAERDLSASRIGAGTMIVLFAQTAKARS